MWWVLWAKVTLQPLYSDVRFQPADKLNAGCTNSADILFAPQGQSITRFKIVLYYDPATIEILRILPIEWIGQMSSKIEYDKIILEVKNPIFADLKKEQKFFQIIFKGNNVGKELITLGTWSVVATASTTTPLSDIFTLNFAQVPECEPDIVPPSINLIYPKDTQQRIGLDQYFIFNIKDIGKWVDKNSIRVDFDNDQYFYGSDSLKRNGNYLTFSPSKRIPIDAKMDLKISMNDKQSYGWSNKAQTTYSFTSATWMVLEKNIGPLMYRQIALQAQKIVASAAECAVLANFYKTSDAFYQKDFRSIIQKVWCDISSVDTSMIAHEQTTTIPSDGKQQQLRNLSVFATVGWILFFISFTLKMHYFLAYKRHKNIIDKRKMNS